MNYVFERIAIVGVGLIGGSLALGWKKALVASEVIGIDVNEQSLSLALSLGAIDRGYTSIDQAMQTPLDVIVLATHVNLSIELLKKIASLSPTPGLIITDVSGTKELIQTTASQVLPASVHFIGGHPMAGSHRSGIEAATGSLFENAVYVLTSNVQNRAAAYLASEQKLQAAVERLGAHVLWLDASVHDQVVAAISHIPHIVAAQLVDLVADLSVDNPYYARLAAGGFRDVTRIASGNPELWRDIVRTNQGPLRQLLLSWQKRTDSFLNWIDQNDDQAITDFFARARDFREMLPQKTTGAVRQYFELTVHVPDEPGVIGRVATLLGEASINLRNIAILENREGENAPLLLAFATQVDWEQGTQLLEENGYAIFIKE
ncbi:MAG: prephenate dehydrogenase [Bacilli bacterium]|nr:prephenate dehydrogenase [Bacilli bacterium]